MRRTLAALLLAGALAPAAARAGEGAPPDELEARYQAGVAAFRAGQPYAALEHLGPVVARRPDYRDAQLLLGQSYLLAGMERQAKRQFEELLARRPDDGQAAFLVGFALYRSARWYEAVTAFDRAHALARANPYPLLYRGLSRLELGDPEAARTDIQTALRLAPDDDTVQYAAAELEFAEGAFHAAELRLQPLVARTGDPEQTILLARALLEQGEAAAAVEALAGVDSERSDLLYVRAQALLRSGQHERGRQELARFRARKAVEERLRLLEATVSTDPGDAEARLELAGLLLDVGNRGGAGLHLTALRRQLPGDPRVAKLTARWQALRP